MIFYTGAWGSSETGYYFALDQLNDDDLYRTNMRNNANSQMIALASPTDSASFDPTVVQYTYSYNNPTNSASIFGFGDQLASGSSSTNQPDGGIAARLPRIGYNSGAADRAFAGLLSEMLIFEGDLTEEQTQQVGFYLADKYDIQTSYIPEPGAIALLAGTLALLLVIRRRR